MSQPDETSEVATPTYVSDAILAMKAQVRAQLDAHAALASVRDAMRREVDVIQSATNRGHSVIPEVPFSHIENSAVSATTLAEIRHRGCLIVRGVFSPAQAQKWDAELGNYLERNRADSATETDATVDGFFSDDAQASKQIFGIYWSRPQIEARQAPAMAVTKRFLNRLWDVTAPAGPEFDPDHDYSYADRLRRRAPGDTSLGLRPHMDSGSYERWVDPAFQKIYEPIFAGDWQSYDPWKAAHRTQTREHDSPTVCSAFRTFQGWTALTPQGPGNGTLQLFPVATGIADLLLRSLQDDVADDELLLAEPGRSLRADETHHPEIIAGMVTIPEVQPGDTVWWHPDIVHAVESEHRGTGYSNVIYIAATPRCRKNLTYAQRQASHFLAGLSSPDFPAEHLETDFDGRATIDDLSDLGRAQMGL